MYTGRIEAPLKSLHSQLVQVRQDIEVRSDLVSTQLSKLHQSEKLRSTLELLLNTSHVVSKVEKLLKELEEEKNKEDLDIGSRYFTLSLVVN